MFRVWRRRYPSYSPGPHLYLPGKTDGKSFGSSSPDRRNIVQVTVNEGEPESKPEIDFQVLMTIPGFIVKYIRNIYYLTPHPFPILSVRRQKETRVLGRWKVNGVWNCFEMDLNFKLRTYRNVRRILYVYWVLLLFRFSWYKDWWQKFVKLQCSVSLKKGNYWKINGRNGIKSLRNIYDTYSDFIKLRDSVFTSLTTPFTSNCIIRICSSMKGWSPTGDSSNGQQ